MKINIVHIGFFYSGGGERVALEQARLLRERGHKVKVFAPIIRDDKCFPELLKKVEPEELITHFPSPIFREAIAMISSAILPIGIRKLADCDVLLCHSQPSMWIGYRTNKLLGIPYVGYLHQPTTFIYRRPEVAGSWAKGDFLLLDGLLGVFGKRVARNLDRICHKSANRLIFNSLWTKSLFEKMYGLSGEVCYPALEMPSKSSSENRENMIITASRHYPWKRIDLAFQVMSLLKGEKPQFIVVGDHTPHTQTLKKIVAKLGLQPYVNFTGFVTNTMLDYLYARSSAYVQTSIHEPFGLGPLEAQSHGTPAVVWGDAGVKETVLNGETGFHAKPYSIEDFSSKLSILLSDPKLWKKMSHEATIWASSFNWESHIDLLEQVLEEETK